MLAWWMLLPTLLAMMVALVLPGFMWLRAGGRSSLVAIGAAPAFTFGLVTILSVAYPALDIEWEPSTAHADPRHERPGRRRRVEPELLPPQQRRILPAGSPPARGDRRAQADRRTSGGDPRGHVGRDPRGLPPRGRLAPRDGSGPRRTLSSSGTRRSIRTACTRSSTARTPAPSAASTSCTAAATSTIRRAGTLSSRCSRATTRSSRPRTCPRWRSWPCG